MFISGALLRFIAVSGIFNDNTGGFGWYWNRDDPKPKAGFGSVKPIYLSKASHED